MLALELSQSVWLGPPALPLRRGRKDCCLNCLRAILTIRVKSIYKALIALMAASNTNAQRLAASTLRDIQVWMGS